MKRTLSVILSVLCFMLLLSGCDGEAFQFPGREVSETDVQTGEVEAAVWEQASSDEAYIAMMEDKLDEFILGFTELSGEKERLAELGSKRKILSDVRFTELSGELNEWCECAVGYSDYALEDEQAKEICRQTAQLGSLTSEFLAAYPELAGGGTSGGRTMEDYENEIVNLTVAVFELVMA